MTFGTFDLFHPGHVFYLSEAESYGDELFVIIARDERVKQLKGRSPHDSEETRRMNVSYGFKHAKVLLGDKENIFAPLFVHQPDILVFGYDQRVPEEKIREFFPQIEIIRVGSYEPEKWKSSILREKKEKEARESL